MLEKDVKRILELQIGGREDKHIWAYTNHGAYTVKSGYWMLANLEARRTVNITALEQQRLALKRRVWKISTVPKIRMFLWRVLSGALAVGDRLQSRGLNVQSTCSLCRHEPETINHMLFRCDKAQELWQLARYPRPPQGFSLCLEENLRFLFDSMENQVSGACNARHLPWLLWNIWKNRNSILYAETQKSPGFWVNNAEEEAFLWFEVKEQAKLAERQNSSPCDKERWCPPTQSIVKCNVHMNWRNKSMQSGGAWIARDHTGNVLFHGRDAFTPSNSRLEAELRGIIWVLQSAKDLHLLKVNIASDHLKMIEAISTPNSWPRFRHLLEKIGVLCNLFSYVAFEVEGVHANTIARDIAKSVLKDGRFQSYLALGGPAWLHQRIAAEASRQD